MVEPLKYFGGFIERQNRALINAAARLKSVASSLKRRATKLTGSFG